MFAAHTHPSADTLRAYHAGRLSEAAMHDLAFHLAGCEACVRFLAALPEDPLVALARPDDAPAADTPSDAFPTVRMPTAPRPHTEPIRRRRWAVVAGAVVAVAAGVIAWRVW